MRVVAIVACVLVAHVADARPKPGNELAIADLGWPATTKSARALIGADVARVAGRSDRFGKLAAGTRVTWKRIVASADRCGAWLEIEPRGWVCAKDLAASDDAPGAAYAGDPGAVVAATLARRYVGVAPDGALAYAAPKRTPKARALDGLLFLANSIKTITVANGSVFAKTGEGYIALEDLRIRPPSEFEGVELAAATPWPIAWVVPAGVDGRVAVMAEPVAGKPIRTLERRARVAVLEQRAGFARIAASEWIALAEIRIAGTSKRPKGVRADEHWIDVDLDQNTLVAYTGDTPVYATLVSTGFGSTPPSLHRIVRKNALRTLQNPSVALGTWDFPDVPFVMEFRKYYALHAVYWHDGFGKKRGHGCVNLSPRDARAIYDFTFPNVPEGWSQGDARDGEGTPIRIRDAKHPDPPWMPWDVAPPTATR
ncbi:MAG: L,D-transpeptidase [Kofleriaceae bacterium]